MPGAFKALETRDLICLVVGDIFVSSMQMLVNPVNTVGVMGRGLALQFKNMYPEMFLIYSVNNLPSHHNPNAIIARHLTRTLMEA